MATPQGQEDPDPTPYIYISMETKRKDQTKPYDGKKMVWVADEKEGYVMGLIKETKGDMCVVEIEGQEVSLNVLTNTKRYKAVKIYMIKIYSS